MGCLPIFVRTVTGILTMQQLQLPSQQTAGYIKIIAFVSVGHELNLKNYSHMKTAT
jgi:hypothetical protein